MISLVTNHGGERKNLCDDLRLIIFDKDGTLIDIHYYWAAIIRLRAQKIQEILFSRSSDPAQIRNRLAETMGLDIKTGRLKPEGPVVLKPRSFIVKTVAEAVGSLEETVDPE